MCPSPGSVHATPRFPPVGPEGHGSPPSQVLSRRSDSRSRIPWAYCFAVRYRASLLGFVPALNAPGIVQARCRTGVWIDLAGLPIPACSSHGRNRASQVPWRPFPRLCAGSQPRTARHASPMAAFPVQPLLAKPQRHHHWLISGLTGSASSPPCVRFTTCVATRPATRGSGWRAGLCRAGVEPAGTR